MTATNDRKLTTEQVEAIRERYAAGGVTQRQLADQHGVSQPTMHHLLTGRLYADAPGPIAPRQKAPPARARPTRRTDTTA